MKCIAIDPGTAQSAFVVWNGTVVEEADTIANEAMLEFLSKEHPPAECAIEMVACYGMAVGKDVFDTVFWIGRFYQQWMTSNFLPARLIYRREIKLHHCASPHAKDTNIRQALIDKYGPPGVKKNPGVTYGLVKHEWSAFAIATYVTEQKVQQERQLKLVGAQ